MNRRSMMKKAMAAFILTAFLSVTLSAAEAAPHKKMYPYPAQQQNQQNSRPAPQQPRPGSPRSGIQQPRPASPHPRMQQSPAIQRTTTQRPKPVVQRTTTQRLKPTTQRTTIQRPKPVVQRTTMQRPKPVMQRRTTQRPKNMEVNHEKVRPKVHDPQQNVVKPQIHDSKQDVVRPKVHNPQQNVAKPKVHDLKQQNPKPRIHGQKQHAPRPKMHEQRQSVSKPATHRPEYRKHRKQGPRKDLHRPPVLRTYENMHVWRHAPKLPKDYWWNHRPAHRLGRYRGYYNGIYYTDVLSALVAAEIIHYNYYNDPVNVIYYAEDSARTFIPKEAIKYKGHHYLVFSDIGTAMEDAQQFCESMGGHLATVGDDKKNERLYRLINDSGYDNEYFEKFGNYRMIPDEPVTYVKADQESNSEEELFYGLYYWNYKNLMEDGTTDGTGGNAFVCEWDK